MDYIYGVILGLLDGFSEVFPVSRVGHRAMLERLAVIPSALAENEALELLLRMGVLAGVILAFRKTVWRMITGFADMAGGIFTGRFRWQKAGRYQRMALLALLGAVPTLLLAWLRRYYDFAVALQGNLIFTGVMLLVMAGLIYIGTHSICHNWTMTDMTKSRGRTRLLICTGSRSTAISPRSFRKRRTVKPDGSIRRYGGMKTSANPIKRRGTT